MTLENKSGLGFPKYPACGEYPGIFKKFGWYP